MTLTEKEKAICKEYRAKDEEMRVHCYECPLLLRHPSIYTCYANIDGRTKQARELKRL